MFCKKTRFISLLLVLVLILVSTVTVFGETDLTNGLGLSCRAYMVVDMMSGEVLSSHNSDMQLYPSSLSKILTAILVIENLDLATELVVDEEACNAGGIVLGLKEGEVISTEALLNAMLIRSANDCAVVLAKALSGSLSEFNKMLNSKAVELGCTGTHFTNPHGLQDNNHYSTASDLAKIATYCMQNDAFCNIVSKSHYIVPETNLSPAREISSTNYLLYDEKEENRINVNGEMRFCKYEGCTGIKTGYSAQAGGCMIATAEKGSAKILVVVLQSSTYGRFSDSILLFDWAFSNCETLSLFGGESTLGKLKVKHGKNTGISYGVKGNIELSFWAGVKESDLSYEYDIPEYLTAPVKENERIGSVKAFCQGIEIKSYDVVALEGCEAGSFLSYLGFGDNWIIWTLFIALSAIVLFFVSFFIWAFFKKRQIKKKKAALAIKKAEREAARQEALKKANDEATALARAEINARAQARAEIRRREIEETNRPTTAADLYISDQDKNYKGF